MATRISACGCTTGDTRFFCNGQCLACCGSQVRNTVRERTLLRNQSAKVPTEADFLGFNGAHCRELYATLPPYWLCPSCNRSKFQVLRWTTLFPDKPEQRREGWAGGYHRHHDHGESIYGRRFERTTICEQCNSTDGMVKRKFKLPDDFSYSPTEIGRMVTAFAHGKHLVDYNVASAIYMALRPLKELPPIPKPTMVIFS